MDTDSTKGIIELGTLFIKCLIVKINSFYVKKNIFFFEFTLNLNLNSIKNLLVLVHVSCLILF